MVMVMVIMKRTKITSVKTQCNKSLNDLCEIQYQQIIK